ncbi:MAG: UvrD-helicase domain-containing protein [Tissierellia bacterium]|nr:UvrD-helicase domain-containing protein [Tissierellia bacterium]
MNFNSVQKKAIETIDQNICLIAGAGTGKTAVLTERCLNIYKNGRLIKGQEIPSVLAITFTEKAALEMKQRLGKKLGTLGRENPKYAHLAQEFVHAPIYTIHSFCSQLLREYPIEGKVPLDFQVLDEGEIFTLQRETMKKVLKKYEKDPRAITFFSDICSMSNLDQISNVLLQLYGKMKNRNVEIKIPKESGETLKKEDFLSLFSQFQDFAKLCRKNTKIYKYFETENLDYIDALESPMEWILEIQKMEERLGSSLKGKEPRDKLEEKIKEFLAFGEKLNQPFYQLIYTIINDFKIKYTNAKYSQGYLDFDDLIEKALDLVKNPLIGEELRNTYKYIMVDEFQDTDPLQCELIFELCKKEKPYDGANLFIVGDPKQSIYQFRGSDVNSFLNMVYDMKKHGAILLEMKENYRSSGEILKFVNMVFGNKMDSYISLYPGLEKVGPNPGIIINSQNEEEDNISNYILKLCKDNYEYGDIALLFRAGTSMEKYENALKDKNIPVVNHNSMNFYTSREILDVTILLEGILYDDTFHLVSVLRCPYINLSEESIYAIIHGLEIENKEDEDKYTTWMDTRKELRSLLKYMEVLEFIEMVMERFQMKVFIAEDDEFYIRRGNLEKFLDLAYDFQNKKNGSLEEFLKETIERRNISQEGQYIPEGDVKGVHLLTIHGSKGLEFPVVILPEAGKKTRGSYDLINISPSGKLGLREGYSEENYRSNLEEYNKLEMEEELRIQYVACTRAKECLIFSGLEKSKEGSLGKTIEAYKESMEKINENTLEVDMFSEDKVWSHVQRNPLYKIRPTKKGRVKKFYTISEYLTFQKDPIEYYLQYILKIPLEVTSEKGQRWDGVSPLELGNIYHKYMEVYEEGRSLNDICTLLNLSPSKLQVDILKEMISHTQTTINDEVEILKEVEFYFPVKDKIFHGFVDQYRFNKDKGVVWDLKTNSPKNDYNELESYYRPQILLYTMAMEEAFKRETSKGILYFARTNEKREVLSTDEKRSKLLYDLETFIDTVESPTFEDEMLNKIDISKYF